MASTRDTIPDPDGTKVLQVDGKGKTVGGELGGKTFRTVRWSVRAQQKRGVGWFGLTFSPDGLTLATG